MLSKIWCISRIYENQKFLQTDTYSAGHMTTVLWSLAGDATVEGEAAGLAINIQRLWLFPVFWQSAKPATCIFLPDLQIP